MKHGKPSRNTDVENVVKELNLLRKKATEQEEIITKLRREIRGLRNNLYNTTQMKDMFESQLRRQK